MLLFAHVGLALASARFWRGAALCFVALGSMLPDIIDKPLAQLVDGIPGRAFAHTILFLVILLSLAFSMKNIIFASISLGVFIHLALDSMWMQPVILFWPVLGDFPAGSQLDTWTFIKLLLHGLNNPAVLAPEMIGLSYIVYLTFVLAPELSKKSQDGLRVLMQLLFKS